MRIFCLTGLLFWHHSRLSRWPGSPEREPVMMIGAGFVLYLYLCYIKIFMLLLLMLALVLVLLDVLYVDQPTVSEHRRDM